MFTAFLSVHTATFLFAFPSQTFFSLDVCFSLFSLSLVPRVPAALAAAVSAAVHMISRVTVISWFSNSLCFQSHYYSLFMFWSRIRGPDHVRRQLQESPFRGALSGSVREQPNKSQWRQTEWIIAGDTHMHTRYVDSLFSIRNLSLSAIQWGF